MPSHRVLGAADDAGVATADNARSDNAATSSIFAFKAARAHENTATPAAPDDIKSFSFPSRFLPLVLRPSSRTVRSADLISARLDRNADVAGSDPAGTFKTSRTARSVAGSSRRAARPSAVPACASAAANARLGRSPSDASSLPEALPEASDPGFGDEPDLPVEPPGLAGPRRASSALPPPGASPPPPPTPPSFVLSLTNGWSRRSGHASRSPGRLLSNPLRNDRNAGDMFSGHTMASRTIFCINEYIELV